MRLALRASVGRSEGTRDSGEVLLLLGGGNHVGSSLLSPAVDEIAVRAPRVTTCKLDGGLTVPAVGENLAQVVADAEAQLGHRLATLGAPVGGTVVAGLVGGLEGLLVDALGEVEELLQMGAAGRGREAIGADGNGLALAGPLSLGVSGHISFGFGVGISSDHLQVLGDGDLSGCLAEVVVGAEAHNRDGLEVRSIGSVQRRGDPVDGQIVGVLGVGAALLQLGAGLGVDGDGVGAEERVQMGLAVLAGEDNGINVLEHEGGGNVDLGVGLGSADKKAGGEKNGRRHLGS